MTLLEHSTTGLDVNYGNVQVGVFISPRGVLCHATDVCSSSSLDVNFVHNIFLDSHLHRRTSVLDR